VGAVCAGSSAAALAIICRIKASTDASESGSVGDADMATSGLGPATGTETALLPAGPESGGRLAIADNR
jgi:hypothetical protein